MLTSHHNPVFACFNLFFLPVVYFLYPETANRTLEDMNAYFDADSAHKTIIPIGDKIAKQTARPLEAIEAEQQRIEEESQGYDDMAKGKDYARASHIETVGNEL